LSRHLTPLKILGAAVGLFLLTIVILYSLPSADYILLPAGAHPVAPLVQVKGNHHAATGGGTIYFVDVFERPARELEYLFPWLHPHATLVPAKFIVPPGSTDQAQIQAAFREMAQSQRIAAAVAERQVGLHVVTHADGVLIDTVYDNVPAAAKLDPADVIVAADGKPTPTRAALEAALAPVKPGQSVDLKIRRGAKVVDERVKTIDDPQHPGRPLIGILVEPAVTIEKLPVKVSIDTSGIGGPSAGLAFTLEVMEKLGRNVTHGYNVAATGTISIDGSVGPIGGVVQKTWGVRDAGADVFLVPAGQNANDARHNAGPNLKIIPVTSLKQALRALATLPPKK
jgi:PDZ domain-containing protein